jgi:Spy/CpxP family protein refolding chaperone
VVTRRLKAYAAIVAVFLLGGVAGGAASWAFAQRQYSELLADDREGFERGRVEALAQALDLSKDQRDRVAAIFSKHREERHTAMRTVMERCGEPVRDHHAKVDAEIHAVLLPAQRTRYDALVAKHRARFTAKSAAQDTTH